MPLWSPSKLWGSGGNTVNLRSSTSEQSRSGGGRGMHASGRPDRTRPRGRTFPTRLALPNGLALGGSEPVHVPNVRRVGGDERVPLTHQRLVEQLVPQSHVRERAPERVDPLEVELQPHTRSL